MTWFYILTLQWAVRGAGFSMATISGTVGINSGALRSGVVSSIISDSRQKVGPEAANATVLFFSLEPESLEASPLAGLPAGGAS